MHPLLKSRSTFSVPTLVLQALRIGILLLPTGLLVLAALRQEDAPLFLWLGSAFQLFVCLLTFLSGWGTEKPLAQPVIMLYLIALGWLWWGTRMQDDWYLHLARAILLVVPMGVFALQTLTESGAPALRRARLLAERLAARQEWPSDLAACRGLPEVKALREALHIDATPALALLHHPRLQVRVAALSALEFRKDWRPGQAEYVLHVAKGATEPAIRAAAVTALGNLDERPLVETLASFLRDPSWEVRRAATEALLWDTEHRWTWIRQAVRAALADPLLQKDGALRHDGNLLTAEAVSDLNAWATEKGVLAARAALTLSAHYARALSEQSDQALVEMLKKRLADYKSPAILRMELARILLTVHELDAPLLAHLLDPANPAPLRLTAVEALMGDRRDCRPPAEALAALRDLARLPNREIAVATAELVQRRLGMDLGLPSNQPAPPLHSRQAAEVTRRVMMWAAQHELPANVADSQPLVER